MRIWFDQFAKAILGALLQPVAEVETEHEITGHVQKADVWVKSSSGHTHADEQAQLGALGRMIARGPCLIEPFSQTPRPRDIRACVCKQYSLDHIQANEAARDEGPTPPFPRLWIVSPGQPRTVIEQAHCRPMEGWPDGFWEGISWDALHIVVVNSLPQTPDTLPLRLLGRGRTFAQAIHELGELPETVWPTQKLVRVLVAFRSEMPHDPMEEEVMQVVHEIDAIYEKWERRVKADDRRGVLLHLLRQRFGDLPDHVTQRIQEADMEQLQRWTERVIPARTLPDVFE